MKQLIDRPLREFLTSSEYAKKHKITRQGVAHRIARGIIPREKVILLTTNFFLIHDPE